MLNIIPWKYGLYILLWAYLIFVGISMYELNEKLDFTLDHPAQVTKETREMKTRVLEMKHTMPGLLAQPNLSDEEIENVLASQEAAQDKSFARIKELFTGDHALLDAQEKAMAHIRKVRRNAVKALRQNSDYNTAMRYYMDNVEPEVSRMYDCLDAIFKASDSNMRSIRAEIDRETKLNVILSLVLGAIIFIAFIYMDSREKAKNRELTARERLFSQLSQNVDEVFIIALNDARFEYVTTNSEWLIDIPPDDITGNPARFYQFLPEPDADWLRKQLSADSQLNEMEEKDVTVESDGRIFKLGVSPIINQAGKREHYIIALRDQTKAYLHQQALRDALENAHSASEAKSNFLSHMSHEIRTPMNAIIGMTTIAISRINDRPRVQDCLAKIAESSRHLLGLINDVLDMSKIENGKLAINSEPFNLRGAIENINNLARPQAVAKNINFDIRLEHVDEERFLGDPLRLNQILLNILSNSIKFTPPGGTVCITILQVKKWRNNVRLRFTISDSGIGMSEEFLKRLYQPFEQASTATTSKYGGTGLGMSITYNLINLMGGSISVKSKEGSGTTFTVELPFLINESAPTTPHTLPVLKVLVVDDDPGTCEHASMLLENMGMQVYWTVSGENAVRMVAEAYENGEAFDVCFIDWKMPDMNGAETARHMRSRVPDDLLIIIISAYDWSPLEAEAKSVGINAFIAKPFFASTLYDALISATRQLKAFSKDKADEDGEQAKEHKADFTGKRILLVEDNEFNMEIGQEFLEMAHAEVVNAFNGKEAVDKFAASPENYFDMILMDVQMPIMDGYEATGEIRRLNRADAATVPILAMTANAFNEDVAHAMASGMNGHIAKPIDIKTLYCAIQEHLGEKGGS